MKPLRTIEIIFNGVNRMCHEGQMLCLFSKDLRIITYGM